MDKCCRRGVDFSAMGGRFCSIEEAPFFFSGADDFPQNA
jgi:hypothetical protein